MLKTVETPEFPQGQHTERIVDVTVVMPQEVPTIQSAQKMVGDPQNQYLDRVVDVPVAMKRQTSLILKVTRTAGTPPVAVH